VVKIVFSDFDGTLTLENREMTHDFFEILNLLKKNNIEFIPVSGRSLSWGHFFLTHFPSIKTTIMEGGGVISHSDGKIIRDEPLVSNEELLRLKLYTEKMQQKFKGIPLSVDSYGRLSDRAIEFELMHEAAIEEVMRHMEEERINYSKSNVHINFWCGDVSKYLGVKTFMEKYRPNVLMDECLFFGDAPNDQSMFEFFPNSIGVSNIEKCLHKLTSKPKTILEGPENAGPAGVLNYLRSKLK
jgi:HAD superfamily hydrolase (TIGR01484 family)